MGFCYPGTGKSGDLAPRTECAPLWRQRLLDGLPRITLTLVIGQYALAWHLSPESPVTDAVRDWRTHWPGLLPLPHPSPRNNGWLKRHPWFDAEVVPALQHRVQAVLAGR